MWPLMWKSLWSHFLWQWHYKTSWIPWNPAEHTPPPVRWWLRLSTGWSAASLGSWRQNIPKSTVARPLDWSRRREGPNNDEMATPLPRLDTPRFLFLGVCQRKGLCPSLGSNNWSAENPNQSSDSDGDHWRFDQSLGQHGSSTADGDRTKGRHIENMRI